MKETLWAIKIGKEPKDSPYFMISRFDYYNVVPMLFASRSNAKPFKVPHSKIVKVEIREVKTKRSSNKAI